MSIQPRGGRRGADYFLLFTHFRGLTNGTWYVYVNSTNTLSTQFNTTETTRDMPADFKFLVRRIRVTVDSNSVTGNTVVSFRRNAATPVGCSVTVASTVTGDSATGVLSTVVEAGDLIDFGIAVTDGAANTVSGAVWVTCQRIDDES